ncbi:MAG TPA: hypothetical protein VJ570_09130 [Holophagaceae bacterium]|nr:hypothetical protein [Holophagaceae bacterium]
MPRRTHAIASLLGFALLLACDDPAFTLQKFQAFEAGTLSFLQDGRTTRQEVLLRLGTPISTFEGERILTYDFVRMSDGGWHRVGVTATSDWRFGYVPGACSLVLVFGPEGVLQRHSLVRDREPAPPPKAEPDPAAP